MPQVDPDEAGTSLKALWRSRSAPQGSGARWGRGVFIFGSGHAPRLEHAHLGLAGEPLAALAGLPMLPLEASDSGATPLKLSS